MFTNIDGLSMQAWSSVLPDLLSGLMKSCKRQEVTAHNRCCPGIETWESTQKLQADCVPKELTLPPNILLVLILHCLVTVEPIGSQKL